MIDVYLEIRGSRPEHYGTARSSEEAGVIVGRLAMGWVATKPNRTAKRVGSEWHFLFSDGRLAGVAFLDFFPPPAGDEPGQTKRKVGRPA